MHAAGFWAELTGVSSLQLHSSSETGTRYALKDTERRAVEPGWSSYTAAPSTAGSIFCPTCDPHRGRCFPHGAYSSCTDLGPSLLCEPPGVARTSGSWSAAFLWASLAPSPVHDKLNKHFFFCLSFVFLWPHPGAYGGSQARGLNRATPASLHHSHSNEGFDLHL